MLRQIRKRGAIALSCLFALLLATGCFQSAGESLQATSVSQGATFTPIPIPTSTPTEAPVDEPEETVEAEITEEVAEETEPPIEIVQGAPSPSPTLLIIETPEPETQQSANVQGQIEPPEMTATYLIERATQQAALEMTMTADAIATPIVPTLPPTAIPTSPGIPVTQPPPSGGSCVHVVSAGENLFRISLRYGTTVHVLQQVNGIANINIILVGQRITIPNCSGGGVPPPPPGGGTIHVVMQGENLFRISLRYGVSLSSILAANPQITNQNLIYINQQIVIPGV
ncbi:MAG: hypothetical protein CL610_03395 [Anaerolineaceae bacterium]|nr:hypothetical protein [Anaerolineaceae bacterium]